MQYFFLPGQDPCEIRDWLRSYHPICNFYFFFLFDELFNFVRMNLIQRMHGVWSFLGGSRPLKTLFLGFFWKVIFIFKKFKRIKKKEKKIKGYSRLKSLSLLFFSTTNDGIPHFVIIERNDIFYNTNLREVDHYECCDKLKWEVQWQSIFLNSRFYS